MCKVVRACARGRVEVPAAWAASAASAAWASWALGTSWAWASWALGVGAGEWALGSGPPALEVAAAVKERGGAGGEG